MVLELEEAFTVPLELDFEVVVREDMKGHILYGLRGI